MQSLCCRLLAALCLQICDPSGDFSFAGRSDPAALAHLPLYLVKGECWSELKELLTSLPFVAALSEVGQLRVLLRFSARKGEIRSHPSHLHGQ